MDGAFELWRQAVAEKGGNKQAAVSLEVRAWKGKINCGNYRAAEEADREYGYCTIY